MKYRNLINEIINENVNKKLNEGWFSKNKDKKEEPKQEEPKKEEPKPIKKTKAEIERETENNRQNYLTEKSKEFQEIKSNNSYILKNLIHILYGLNLKFDGYNHILLTDFESSIGNLYRIYVLYSLILFYNEENLNRDIYSIENEFITYEKNINSVKNYLKKTFIPSIKNLEAKTEKETEEETEKETEKETKIKIDKRYLDHIYNLWNDYKKNFDKLLSYAEEVKLKLKELKSTENTESIKADFGELDENRIRKIVKEEFIKLYKKKRSL